MIDTHYDLLSIAYTSYLKNDFSYLEKISKYFHEKNVKGVIANLYFMSEEEMKNEEHPDYYKKEVSVLDMFIISKTILDHYLPEIDILYSIEGADYIKGVDELEKLYEAGLDALMIVWNNKNRYGSGNRSDEGLTADGVQLIQKAISLDMGIDLSHANKNTFNDIIKVIKINQDNNKDVCCYASHSNSRTLCSRDRNLDDEQLRKLAGVNGLVGVVSTRNFVVEPEMKDTATDEEKKAKYLEHIDYITSIIGEDKIMLATDDMDFCKDADPEYGEVVIYNYETIGSVLAEQLFNKYGEETTYKMMYGNAKEKVFNKIRSRRKERGVK